MNKRCTALLLLVALGTSGCSYLPSWLGGKKEEHEKLKGERVTVLPIASELKPDATLQHQAVALPPIHTNADWPQHSGVLQAAGGNLSGGAFTEISHAKAGEGHAFAQSLVPRPVIGGGLVFSLDGVGYISAREAGHIGTLRWQSKGVHEHGDPEIIGGGLAYDQGKLYATSGRGTVAAFDAQTGKQLWRKELHTPFRSAPRVAGDKLFAITIDNALYALNTANGDGLWSHQGMNETAGILASLSPVMAGGSVIVPYSSGELYALSASDGKEQWVNSLGTPAHTAASNLFTGIGGDPVVDGQVVFAVSNGGLLSAVTANGGDRVWDKQVAAMNTPWLAGNYLFLLAADNTLVCFYKYDGRVQWATRLPSFANEKDKRDPITWKGPVLVNGKLAVTGSHGTLMLISAADGKVLATSDIADGIYTAPVVAGGVMYLVGQNAKLYMLQ